MAPAGKPDRLADMALAERAAGVGPVTMHGRPKNKCRRIESGALRLPRKEGQGLPERVQRGNRMQPKRASRDQFGTIRPKFGQQAPSLILQPNRGSPRN
jgi:hypothetical protein